MQPWWKRRERRPGIENAAAKAGVEVGEVLRWESSGPLRESRAMPISKIPQQPTRPFEADYPAGVAADESGRLLQDIEGRPLFAPTIVGRRVVQGADEALPLAEPLAKAVTGNDIAPFTGGNSRVVGQFVYQDVVPHTLEPGGQIWLRPSLDSTKREWVLRHEIGHAIDEIAGEISTQGVVSDLERIYDAGLSGRVRERGLANPLLRGRGLV